MKSAAIAAAGVLLAATPAFAQTGGDDAPGFGGLYVGAAGGLDAQSDQGSRMRIDRDLDTRFGHLAAAGVAAPRLCSHGSACDDARASYSGRVGFDVQMGAVVLGAVGEVGRGGTNDRATRRDPRALRRNVTEAGTRARLGYTPDDATLIYGTAGPGRARFARATPRLGDDDRSFWGVQGGAGVERRVGEHLSLGLEYLHHRYAGKADGDAPDTQRVRWHSVRATAAFRF